MEKLRKNLVFTSAGDNTDFDTLWLEKDRNYDVWVVYYGENEKIYQMYVDKVDLQLNFLNAIDTANENARLET